MSQWAGLTTRLYDFPIRFHIQVLKNFNYKECLWKRRSKSENFGRLSVIRTYWKSYMLLWNSRVERFWCVHFSLCIVPEASTFIYFFFAKAVILLFKVGNLLEQYKFLSLKSKSIRYSQFAFSLTIEKYYWCVENRI